MAGQTRARAAISLPLTPPPAPTSVVLAGLDASEAKLASDLKAKKLKVWSAEHAAEAVELTEKESPDLVVLGEQLDADPSHVLAAVREASPDTRVLIIMSGSNMRRAAFLASLGFDDVLMPPISADLVIIRAVVAPLLSWQIGMLPRGGSRMKLVVDRYARTVSNGRGTATLTMREFELLDRLLAAEGRVVSREELLTDIWGKDQKSEAVLDATIHRLRRKLEADRAAPRVLVTIRGIGYRLEASQITITDG